MKRTLTDEQVAMFRHSEIQELLKQRRRAHKKRKRLSGQAGKREVNHGIRTQAHRSAGGMVRPGPPVTEESSELLYDDASAPEPKTSHPGTILTGRTLKSYDDFDDNDTIDSTNHIAATKNTEATFQWPSLKA